MSLWISYFELQTDKYDKYGPFYNLENTHFKFNILQYIRLNYETIYCIWFTIKHWHTFWLSNVSVVHLCEHPLKFQ